MARSTPLAFGVACLCWSAYAASAQLAPTSGPQPQSVSADGAVHVGLYRPVDFKARLKAWLARYTMPMTLAMIDVAYIYDRATFCEAADRPTTGAFFTERFGLARKRADEYEVDKLLQLQKIDYCKPSSSDINRNISVISKTALANRPAPTVINWNALVTIGGIDPGDKGGSSQSKPSQPSLPNHDNTLDTLEFNKSLLLSYRDVLQSKGIRVLVRPEPRSDSIAVAASHATVNPGISRNVRYCLNSPNVRVYPNLGCSDEFGPILRVINTKASGGTDPLLLMKYPVPAALGGEATGAIWEISIMVPR